jgi:hypothetical protein
MGTATISGTDNAKWTKSRFEEYQLLEGMALKAIRSPKTVVES